MTWGRSRTAIPTVVALRRRFEAIRQTELQRLQPKLADADTGSEARVDEVTRLIVEKLLLTPTEQLKTSRIGEHRGDAYARRTSLDAVLSSGRIRWADARSRRGRRVTRRQIADGATVAGG